MSKKIGLKDVDWTIRAPLFVEWFRIGITLFFGVVVIVIAILGVD